MQLKHKETVLLDFELASIGRKTKGDDIKRELQGMHIVKLELDYDHFTGQHTGHARLQMRIRPAQESMVLGAMRDLNIKISNVSNKEHTNPKDQTIYRQNMF